MCSLISSPSFSPGFDLWSWSYNLSKRWPSNFWCLFLDNNPYIIFLMGFLDNTWYISVSDLHIWWLQLFYNIVVRKKEKLSVLDWPLFLLGKRVYILKLNFSSLGLKCYSICHMWYTCTIKCFLAVNVIICKTCWNAFSFSKLSKAHVVSDPSNSA